MSFRALLERGKRVFAHPAPLALTPLMGGRPLSVLLVGARGGPAERWDFLAPDVELVGLEPDPAEHARLSAAAGPGRRYLQVAAGSERGRARLNLTRQPGCSSFYQPNRALISEFSPDIARMFEVVGELEVETAPLDAIAKEHALRPDVLTLDVQGAELSVLRGAEELLPGLSLAEVEVELNPQYLGQPLFGDVDAFLRPKRFELLGLRRTLWRRRGAESVAGGQLIHADALYFNRGRLDAITAPAELVRFLAALSAYQQHDLIELLLREHPVSRALDGDALLARLVPPIRPFWQSARKALVHLPHHLTLRSLVVALREAPAEDWHDPDFF